MKARQRLLVAMLIVFATGFPTLFLLVTEYAQAGHVAGPWWLLPVLLVLVQVGSAGLASTRTRRGWRVLGGLLAVGSTVVLGLGTVGFLASFGVGSPVGWWLALPELLVYWCFGLLMGGGPRQPKTVALPRGFQRIPAGGRAQSKDRVPH